MLWEVRRIFWRVRGVGHCLGVSVLGRDSKEFWELEVVLLNVEVGVMEGHLLCSRFQSCNIELNINVLIPNRTIISIALHQIYEVKIAKQRSRK
jgi:hypothetical protein